MAWTFVRQGGTNASKTTGATTLVATTPAAGHAIGNQVVVATYGAFGNVNPGTVADARGNTYTRITPTSGGQNVASIFVATLTTALVSGDAITWTLPTSTYTGVCICCAEFSGGSTTIDVTGSEGTFATSASPTIGPITPTTNTALVVGLVGDNGPTSDTGFVEDSDSVGGDTWHTLTRTGTTGGSATANVTLQTAYKITTAAAAQTYNPTLGTSRAYSAAIGAASAAFVPAVADLVLAAQRATRPSAYRAARPGMV